jgi:hypothetical protein
LKRLPGVLQNLRTAWEADASFDYLHVVVIEVARGARRAGEPAQLDVVPVLGLSRDGAVVGFVGDGTGVGGVGGVAQPGGHEHLTLPEFAHQVAVRDVLAFAEQSVAVGHLSYSKRVVVNKVFDIIDNYSSNVNTIV